MQIVIDIPERTYEQLKFLREQGFDGFETVIDKAVANGTPLPKEHGRLIDADALIKQLEAMANNRWNIQVGASKGLEEAIDIVDDAPTIIEAESEEYNGRKDNDI